MGDPFDIADMKGVLSDVTNTPKTDDKPSPVGEGGHGWVPKTKYDYNVYNATTREEREAIEASDDAPTWAANASKYEWSDEFGDVGPEHPELEKQLFGGDTLVRSGDQFEKVKEVDVVQEGTVRISPVKLFEDAGLHPIMLQNIKLCRYQVCTPIQAYCLPAIFKGHDVFASAHTGSGKTAAFLIPILSKLMGKAKTLAAPRPNPATFNPATDAVRAEPLVVIIAPTRELATQIFDEARRFCYRSMLRPSVVYGGAPFAEQRLDLQRGCDILIGTPGRLCDFMDRSNLLSLRRVKYTVVDEADEILGADWEEELKKMLHGGDNNPDEDHVYMMFSATFPKAARDLARQFLSEDHVRIRVGRPGSTHGNINQKIIYVEDAEKNRAFYDLLLSLPAARTMVFVNSKRTADYVDDYLFNLDLPSTSIHADRTQREREDALRAFRKGRAPILIATGLSARGLDIREVMHVINYDLPSIAHGGIHEYIHRIGRTARIGNSGLATSFYNDKNQELAELLVKTLLETKQEIPEFLQSFIPDGSGDPGAKLDFQDDSDEDDGTGGEAENPATTEGDVTGAETWDSGNAAATTTTEDWSIVNTATPDAPPRADWNTNGSQAKASEKGKDDGASKMNTMDLSKGNPSGEWGTATPAQEPSSEMWGPPTSTAPQKKPERKPAPHEQAVDWGTPAPAQEPTRDPRAAKPTTASASAGETTKPAVGGSTGSTDTTAQAPADSWNIPSNVSTRAVQW